MLMPFSGTSAFSVLFIQTESISNGFLSHVVILGAADQCNSITYHAFLLSLRRTNSLWKSISFTHLIVLHQTGGLLERVILPQLCFPLRTFGCRCISCCGPDSLLLTGLITANIHCTKVKNISILQGKFWHSGVTALQLEHNVFKPSKEWFGITSWGKWALLRPQQSQSGCVNSLTEVKTVPETRQKQTRFASLSGGDYRKSEKACLKGNQYSEQCRCGRPISSWCLNISFAHAI